MLSTPTGQGPPSSTSSTAVAQVRRDMGGLGRADPARRVGAGGGHRQQHGLEQGACHGMGGDADRHRVQPGGGDARQGRARRLRQDQGQRPRPERRRHGRRPLVEPGDGARAGEIGDMDDQRVVRRAALGAVDARPPPRRWWPPRQGRRRSRSGRRPARPGAGSPPRRRSPPRRAGGSGPQPLQAQLGGDRDQGHLERVAQEEGHRAQHHGLLRAHDGGEPGAAQDVQWRPWRAAGRPRWRASAASARRPSRRCRPWRRSPGDSRRWDPPCRRGRSRAPACPRTPATRPHPRPDRAGRWPSPAASHRRRRSASRPRPAGSSAPGRTAPGSWPRPRAAGCRIRPGRWRAGARRRWRATGGRRGGIGGRRGHGRFRQDRGRCWGPDHRDAPPGDKPRARPPMSRRQKPSGQSTRSTAA